MREHPGRDERGRLLPGRSGNPAGRPARGQLLRLVAAAEACGATVTITVPTRPDPAPPDPPAAA